MCAPLPHLHFGQRSHPASHDAGLHQSMRKRRRIVVWLLALGGLTVVAALLVYRFAFAWEPSLDRKAVRINLRLDDDGYLPSFQFLDRNRLLCRYGNAAGRRVEVEVRTGVEKRLVGLEQVFRGEDRKRDDHSRPQISPDGKWLLWGYNQSGRRIAARMDGSRVARWKGHPLGHDEFDFSFYWMADSRHWAEFEWDGELETGKMLVRCVDTPDRTETIPIDGSHPLLEQYGYGAILAVQTIDRSVVSEFNGNAFVGDRIRMVIGSLRRHSPPRLECTVHFPFDVTIQQAAVSPKGDRVAWLAAYNRASTFFDRLPRWLRFTGTEPWVRLSIWVSNVDGANLREIAHMATPESTTNVSWNKYLADLKWANDGRSLNYFRVDQFHHYRLWRLDID